MAQANVIEVILKAIDQMSADLRKAEGEIARLTGATQRTEQATTRLAGSNRALVSTLGPMRGALGQVTTMLAQMNPQAAVLISSMDNLALSLASVGLRFGSLAAILKTAGVIGLILGITAAIGHLISSWQTATKAQEDFQKSLDELSIQRAGLGISSALGAASAQTEERRRQIARQLAENARAQQGSFLGETLGRRFSGTLSLEQQAALENELALLDAKLAITTGVMTDAIRKQSQARSHNIDVLREEIRVIEAQIALEGDDPLRRGQAAAKMKELELSLLRQLGPEQQAYIDQVVRAARADENATIALEKRIEQLKFLLEVRKKEMDEALKVAESEELALEPLGVKGEQALGEIFTKRDKEVRAMAESMADNFSRTLTDRMVMFMSGEGKFSFQAIGASIGKSLVTMMIQTMLKELLLNPLQKIIEVWARGTGQAPGEFGVFGGLSGLLNIGGWGGGSMGFAHGGMVVPSGALQKFQRGGVVRGPTLGVIGEEGPEIVARMKPMQRGGDEEVIRQNIIIVDRRPPRLERNDVLLILQDDLERGGRTAKGVENVIRRGGHGR